MYILLQPSLTLDKHICVCFLLHKDKIHTYSVMSCVNLEPQWDPIKEGKKGHRRTIYTGGIHIGMYSMICDIILN